MRSLTSKLILAFSFISLVGIALVALYAGAATTNQFDDFIAAQNREVVVQQLQEFYAERGSWEGVTQLRLRLNLVDNRPGQMPGGRMGSPPIPFSRLFTLVDGDGRVIVPGGGHTRGEQLRGRELNGRVPIEVEGETVAWLVAPRGFGPGEVRDDFINRLSRGLLWAGGGALLISLVLGIIWARGLTRPLQELTAATRAVAAGDLEQSVPVYAQDELGELAAAFNQMNRDLAQQRRLRRQMTADIAHDLRTPLSIILGHSEALSEGVLPPTPESLAIIHDEAKRLQRLVEDLRTLSLADAGELPLLRRMVPPAALLERALSAHSPRAQQKGIELTLELEPNLPAVDVDPDRMAQVLDNLLANALRFTPAEGRITLQARRQKGDVALIVTDSGPGISAEEMAHLFDRFYRGDRARQRQEESGSGLGLAIARSIVRGHDGRIHAENGPGGGARFIVTLPAARS